MSILDRAHSVGEAGLESRQNSYTSYTLRSNPFLTFPY